MTKISSSLNSIVIEAKSPDRRICGELSSWDQIEVWFDDEDAYIQYERESLEHQVSALLKSLMTVRERARKEVLGQFEGWQSDKTHWDARRRRYRTELDEIMAEGTSGSGRITIYRVGLLDWMVAVKPNALDNLDEDEFCSEVESALASLKRDYALKVYEMKKEHFGA